MVKILSGCLKLFSIVMVSKNAHPTLCLIVSLYPQLLDESVFRLRIMGLVCVFVFWLELHRAKQIT